MQMQWLLASLWDRMLGLDETMSLSSEDTAFGWAHPLPGWAWLLIVVAAALIGYGSYVRMQGSRWARMGLGTFRTLLLIAIAVLLAGPSAVRTEITPEPDWLLVMVDRSASMGFEDVERDGSLMSREAQLREALSKQMSLFGEAGLGANRNVVWLGYDREAYPIELGDAADDGAGEAGDSAADTLAALGDPTVQATNLRTAIDQALQSAAGRAISGLVLIGDGRSPEPTGEVFADKLLRQDVPVFAVPLGSGEPRLDLAVGRVVSPVSAFAGDLVPVSVTVRRQDVVPGEEGSRSIDLAKVRVRLINADTGEALDEKSLAEIGLDKPVGLQARADEAGELNLSVEVRYEGDESDAGEEIATRNNSRAVSIAMVDRPLKVLYVEGTARWEYRFLVSMLKREESIDSSILLTDADRGFVQEGDTPISRFPQTAEEIRPYDVIVIGDVHPRFFSERQLGLIREHVATRGAGLLWIGGERHTPGRYAGTELELLLPMTNPSGVGRLVPAEGFELPMQPTEAAEQLSLLRLSLNTGEEGGVDGGRDANDDGWPTNLPGFRWAQDLGVLRPGAQTLGEAVGASSSSSTVERSPLVVLYRFGGGEVLYVGTDETWRWRRAGGEVYFEQFWIQLVRKLGRTRVQQLDDRARFVVEPAAVDLGATQLVELTIDDPSLIRDVPRSVRAAVYRAAAQDAEGQDSASGSGGGVIGEAVSEIELRLSADGGGVSSGSRSVYRATWRADRAGRYVLRVIEPTLEALELRALAEVRDPAEELARAATDHDRLIALASATGGAVVPLDELNRLEALVPDRSRELTNQMRQPLVNTLFALLVLLGLLTLEWALRRGLRLV